MTHSGAIAATMMAVADVPIRGRLTSSSCGVTSIVVCRASSTGSAAVATAAAMVVASRPPVQFNPKFLGGGIGLLLVLVVIVWLASGFYIVDASQRGLVLQFGRYKESTESGLRWRLPYPIQSHELVNVSGVRTLEIGYRGTERNKVLKEALMLTDDENIINIQFAVQYILKDPVDYVFANRIPTKR
jgi:hypothetical protein